MAATAKMLLPEGHVYAATGADVPGVICASAPGGYPPPRRRSAIFLTRLLGAAFLGRPAPHRISVLIRALNATEHAHLGVPHWFIYELAVAAVQRGSGLGRRLLNTVLDQADAAGDLVYLETTNEPNIGLYRHFGFELSETLDCGGGVPPIWTMTRQPGA
jgi:ribosomal protein S18 acetylase RimI-like enzyme